MNLIRTLWSSVLCLVLIGGGMVDLGGLGWLSFVLAIVIGGYKQTIEGLKDSIAHKRLNIELLMIMSALGASFLGDFKEGAILIFIFSTAGSLESLTLDRSNRDIRALMQQQPQVAVRVSADGSYESVDVGDIQLNDTLMVAAGDMVPVDGSILTGVSNFEESSITGESIPVQKHVGQRVFGGTLNLSNPIRMVVDSDPEDMVLKRIVKMVEQAQSHQSNVSTLIDRLEGGYALFVIGAVIALVLFEGLVLHRPWSDAMYTGIVLMVVASPCALVASVTPATLAAISNGSRHGLLVKGGRYFEAMADVDVVVFDKTGTLTMGKPEVVGVMMDVDQKTLGVLKSLEMHSSHPLAQAILNYLSDVAVVEASDIKEIKGMGVEGSYEGVSYRFGSLDYMKAIPEGLLDYEALEGYTLVYASKDDVCLGAFMLADAIKPEAKQLVQWLTAHHIEPVMITGDNESVAKKIGDELGINRIIAKALPDDKAKHVQALKNQYACVAMLGDGINDAPALACAHVGIAMSNGTDIAIESADVVFTNGNLMNLILGITLSKKLKGVTRQNIVFSIAVIVCLIFLNLTHSLLLPLGVVFHEGSTILVILNGLRMLSPLQLSKR